MQNLGGQIRCIMGDVPGAYVKNGANFQKGVRFKIRLENGARTRVRFISPQRRAKGLREMKEKERLVQ